MYIYESREIELENEVKNLKEKIKDLTTKPVENTVTGTIPAIESTLKLEKQIESLNSDLDYQIKENEKLKVEIADYQNAIRNCYYYTYKLKKVARPDFRDSVLKLTKEIP